MRPVNLLPDELRARAAGESDPRMAYGVMGGLALLLLMVVLAITYSNKATSLNDEAAALKAEASRYGQKSQPVKTFNDFANTVTSRTLLVGGLAESRFRWDSALRNLSESMPDDVTLDTISAATKGSAPGTADANAASMDLTGCASGWLGLSRFMVRMRNLPGVKDVVGSNSNNQSGGNGGGGSSGSTGQSRKKNCGLDPVTFSVKVVFEPQAVNLVGLPKINGAGSSDQNGATGSTAGAPSPASATAPTGG